MSGLIQALYDQIHDQRSKELQSNCRMIRLSIRESLISLQMSHQARNRIQRTQSPPTSRTELISRDKPIRSIIGLVIVKLAGGSEFGSLKVGVLVVLDLFGSLSDDKASPELSSSELFESKSLKFFKFQIDTAIAKLSEEFPLSVRRKF